MSEETLNLLEVLIGRDLASVVFVRDYVQLGFDGPQLTAVTNPEVITRSKRFVWGDPGYRDALCEQIGKIVLQAKTIEGQSLTISFDNNVEIAISLRPEDYRTAEAAVFTHGDRFVVW
jgi:hypothetical protein